MEFELTTKYYLQVSTDIKEALDMTINFLADLNNELDVKDIQTEIINDALDTLIALYDHCNTNYSINEVFNSED